MTNNNKEWEEEVLKYIYKILPVVYFPNPVPPLTATQEQVLQEFYNYIRTLLQKEREEWKIVLENEVTLERIRICEELEERFIDIWRNSGAKSKSEYYPTLKMLLDELEVIQKINE